MAKKNDRQDDDLKPNAPAPDAPSPEAEKPDAAVAEAPADEVVTVEAVTVELPPMKIEQRDWYYMGATDKCPTGTVHIAGIDFPKFNDPPRESGDGEQFRHRMRGKLMRLTPSQVAKVKRDVLDQFFMFDPTRVQKKTKKNAYYKPSRNDRSVAFFVYMQKVKDPRKLNRDIMTQTPPPMATPPAGFSLYPEGFDPDKRMNTQVAKSIMAVPEDLQQTRA